MGAIKNIEALESWEAPTLRRAEDVRDMRASAQEFDDPVIGIFIAIAEVGQVFAVRQV